LGRNHDAERPPNWAILAILLIGGSVRAEEPSRVTDGFQVKAGDWPWPNEDMKKAIA